MLVGRVTYNCPVNYLLLCTYMTKKIEEEIQTNKFRNMHHKAALNIIVAANWLHARHLDIFKKYDLTGQQYNVLRILRGQYPNPCNLLNLRERMLDKMSDVSRIIERLRLNNFVDRITCENDRRSVDILITKKGLEILKKLEKEETNMDGILSNLTEADAKKLNELLDKLRS